MVPAAVTTSSYHHQDRYQLSISDRSAINQYKSSDKNSLVKGYRVVIVTIFSLRKLITYQLHRK